MELEYFFETFHLSCLKLCDVHRREVPMRILPLSLLAVAMLAGCADTNSETHDSVSEIDVDGDGVSSLDDCDDENAAVFPGAEEICNGVDDNCDGLIDEGQPDTDKDGVVDCADTEDCDGLDNDGDGLVDEHFPDTDVDGTADCVDAEDCDGLDNDGDGLVDEDQPDTDGDGVVDCMDTEDCDGLDNDGDGAVDEGFADNDGDGTADCMDTEDCDGLDNDGDGVVDEDFVDTDGDGTADCVDTEDCDGLDNDGDGTVDEGFADNDGDGTADCMDTEECDGLDNDGDGLTDEGFDADGDGVADCMDTEECDGLDNDGDGLTDEGFDADSDGTADCVDTEDCDGLDNDGDGLTDEGFTDTDGDGIADCIDVEECDGFDNDGDGLTDEGFDDDGDGIADCMEVEVCDGRDNDGDGAIDEGFTDTDRDGTADCVDVEECDGLDNDGDGLVDEGFADDDGDGYTTCDGDCDDGNPSVHPGAPDWMNDAEDSDCDGEEPGLWTLDTAPIYIQGGSGLYDVLGHGIAACDFDEDGRDDLVIGAPFAPYGSYHGKVGVFYGANSDTWTTAMTMSDADTLIEGDGYDFIGFNAKCGDIDGDGHADLVFSRGDISYPAFYNVFTFMIYYGDGTGFPASLREADADANLSLTVGSLTTRTTVYAAEFALGDIDGDGAEDIVVEWPYITLHGEGEILILPGAAYSGSLALDDYISDWWSPDQPLEADMVTTGGYDYQQIRILDDLDGDGLNDVFVGEPYWSTIPGGTTYEGQASFLSDVTDAGGTALADLAYGQFTSTTASQYFGYWAATGDFDADSTLDGAISAIGDATAASSGGGLWVWSDLGAVLALDPSTPADSAVAHVYGSKSGGKLGYRLAAAGDMDGDGYEDLLVSEPFGGSTAKGRVWLLSGALLAGDAPVEDVALWGCEGTTADDGTGLLGDLIGSSLVGRADFDGDGTPDITLAAVNWDDAHSSTVRSGRVAIWLSSSW
jgi:hypothetical protein